MLGVGIPKFSFNNYYYYYYYYYYYNNHLTASFPGQPG